MAEEKKKFPRKNPKESRFSLGVFLFFIFSVVLVLAGFLKIRYSIYQPFDFLRRIFARNREYAFSIDKSRETEILALRSQDTDNDGLSDFEEIYIYGTSPYLDDTDSDGENDKKEIDAGGNPNCFGNDNCDTSSVVFSGESESVSSSESDLSPEEAEMIRERLAESGMPRSALDRIDDETLKNVYNETIKETGINPAGIGDDSSETGVAASGVGLDSGVLEYLEDMSAGEIRELLISYGVDAALLEGIDDAALKELVIQMTAEQTAEE